MESTCLTLIFHFKNCDIHALKVNNYVSGQCVRCFNIVSILSGNLSKGLNTGLNIVSTTIAC